MNFMLTVEIDIEVECSIEPAQNGGRTDPSYDAYANIESIEYDGRSFIPSKELLQQIEDAADEKVKYEITERSADAAEARAESRREMIH